jgi:hypothetical protein
MRYVQDGRAGEVVGDLIALAAGFAVALFLGAPSRLGGQAALNDGGPLRESTSARDQTPQPSLASRTCRLASGGCRSAPK